MTIEAEIYKILENIVEKNLRIQQSDEYSNAEKDNAMRIANHSLGLPKEFLSDSAISLAIVKEYKERRKPE